MKYTLTYTLGDWENTDTIVIYVNITGANPYPWYDNVDRLKDILVSQGVKEDDANYIIQKGLYFIRNCNDTDYEFVLREEKGE